MRENRTANEGMNVDKSKRADAREQKQRLGERFQVTRHIFIEDLEGMNEKHVRANRDGRGRTDMKKEEIEVPGHSSDSENGSGDERENGASGGHNGRRVSWADELVTVHEYIKDKKRFRWSFVCVPVRISL